MEAFSAILEKPLQLTVWTLGQAVRTPSGILVITFYSNIGLGQNQRRWKGHQKCPDGLYPEGKICPSGRPCRKFQNYFPDKKKLARPDDPGSRTDAHATERIFDLILGFQSL
jgi:hypothetical protein